MLLLGVTALPFKVSFVVTLVTTTGVVPDGKEAGVSFTASITLATITIAVAVSQFDGTAPTSHN